MHVFLRNSLFFLCNSKKCINFAVESPTPGFRGREVSPLGKPNYLTKHPSRSFQDIFKRRLLTFSSNDLKLRNFHRYSWNLTTVDVLRDIDYPSCAYFGMPFAYICTRTRVP